ncbi:MAG: VCBS repeat-containing protein [Minicystis sp.]
MLSRRHRRLALAVLAAAALPLGAACRATEPAPPGPPPIASEPAKSAAPAVATASAPEPLASAPVAPAAPVASSPRPPPPRVCRDLLARNRRVLAGHPDGYGLSFATSCYAAGSGAWALRLDRWKNTRQFADVETWGGAYTVVHLDAAGHEVASQPAWVVGSEVSGSEMFEPVQFDFDGDGQPEVFVRQSDKEHEGPFTWRAKLYTFRGGKVVEYPGLPRTYVDLEDADKDGRPDVIYHPYESTRTHPGSAFDFTSEGPALLAHARPDGTFSTTDDAARAFARRDCPARTRPGRDDLEPELCARLWGASETEALAMLGALCPTGAECDGGCAETNDPCAYLSDRKRRLALPPPLRLGP